MGYELPKRKIHLPIRNSSRTVRYIPPYIFDLLRCALLLALPLYSTGEKWFHRRKLLTPTFHFSILQNFMEVFNEQSFILANKLETFADRPEAVNIFPHVTSCVLDIICGNILVIYICFSGTYKLNDDIHNIYWAPNTVVSKRTIF